MQTSINYQIVTSTYPGKARISLKQALGLLDISYSQYMSQKQKYKYIPIDQEGKIPISKFVEELDRKDKIIEDVSG